MKKKLTSYILAFISILSVCNSEPYSLADSNYILNGFLADTPQGTYPPSMVFRQSKKIKDPSLTDTMDSNYELPYNLTAKTRIVGLDSLGILFQNTSLANSGGGWLGEAVLLLNTQGVSNIMVEWIGRTITVGERDYAVSLMYKTATEKNYLPLGSTYINSISENDFLLMPPVKLPISAENQDSLFLIWKYYYIGSKDGSRSGIAIDDIKVSSQPSSIPISAQKNAIFSPNPAKEQLNISFNANYPSNAKIIFYNINGEEIFADNINIIEEVTEYSIELDKLGQNHSVIFVKIFNEKFVINEKIIILH